MSIEEFFRPTGVPGGFPLLRIVAARKDAGYVPVFELAGPKDTLGFRKAKIFVHFYKDGQEEDVKDDDWDDNLNSGLILLGVRSKAPEEEKDRFALGIRAAFKAPEKRYGDGYFKAVLVKYVLQTDFHNHPEIATVLAHIHRADCEASRSYDDCRQMIDAAAKGRAAELLQNLHYEMPVAWDILSGAMARYLDERFSVSSRRLLGLL